MKSIRSTREGLTRAFVAGDGRLLSEPPLLESGDEEVVHADLRNADGVSSAGRHEDVMGSIQKGVVVNPGVLAPFAEEWVDLFWEVFVVIIKV